MKLGQLMSTFCSNMFYTNMPNLSTFILHYNVKTLYVHESTNMPTYIHPPFFKNTEFNRIITN